MKTSTDETLRLGVVGVGHLGSLHAKMLSELQGVTLAGVFDVDRAKAERVAADYGTPAFTTLDALLEHVDAVTIATPTSTHHAVAAQALEQGRHLFIEKPITQTVDEADSLIALAQKKNCLIQVGHIERFNAAVLAVEKYGLNPLFVESHRLAQFKPRGTDVPVVLDLMIHDIDIILSFVHSPVVRVDANGVAVVSDSADIANARLQFANGCVANVTASRISQKKMRKMRMFQRDAYISIDFLEKQAEVFRLVDEDSPPTRGAMMLGQIDSAKRRRNIVYELPAVEDINSLKYELELFVTSIRNGTTPPVTAEEGKRALEVALMILQRIQEQTIHIA